MEQQKRVRNHQFDNMKALLIFLVVLGHVLKNFGTTEGAEVLYKIIFSFHMPVFIFVSGYFAKCDPKRVLSKLFPLYLVFQIARFVLDVILAQITGSGASPMESFQLLTPRWTLWYLFALIVYQLLLPVFTTENRKHRLFYMILAVALGMIVGLNRDAGDFMALSRVLVFLPLFLLGYYEKDSHILMNFGKKKYPVVSRVVTACLAAFLIIAFAVGHNNIPARIFYGTESFVPGKLMWYTRVFAWVVALLWIWILLVWIPEKEIPVVGTIGTDTLPVYLLHSLAIQIILVTPLGGLINGNLAAIIILSAAMTVCFAWTGFEKALRKIAVPYDWKKRQAGV